MFQLHVQLYVVDLIVIAHETQFFYKSKLLHWTRFRFIGSNRLRLKWEKVIFVISFILKENISIIVPFNLERKFPSSMRSQLILEASGKSIIKIILWEIQKEKELKKLKY
jgi:hypothetical protein